jgi:hypothetical protein
MNRASKVWSCVSLSAAALTAMSVLAAAGDDVPLTPGKGRPLDIGNKHAVTYFVEQNGACKVTVVIAAKDGSLTDADSPGTRINAVVMPGMALQVDAADDRSAEFFCGPGGTKMTTRVFARESYAGRPQSIASR